MNNISAHVRVKFTHAQKTGGGGLSCSDQQHQVTFVEINYTHEQHGKIVGYGGFGCQAVYSKSISDTAAKWTTLSREKSDTGKPQ